MKLVNSTWLSAHLNDENLRVLDVRSDVMQYLPGHVPNAVHLSDFSLRAPKNGVPAQYLNPESLCHLFALAGVTDDHHVVVYSQGEGVIGATMTMYALNLIGHTDVSLLDGGWTAYRNTQRVSQQYPAYGAAQLTVRPAPDAMSISLEELKDQLATKRATFVDARPEGAYLGVESTWMRNGHLPGALNVDWHSLVEGANLHQLRPPEEIKALLELKGVRKDQNIVVYCGTSREASILYFILKHLLDYPRVRLYEGSWTEYSSFPELKMETGRPVPTV
ncbi:sulfurtransferase [Deinococcus detaillensis]|uniref:Sulfurtransferase n=1 Tax=Deinococcus detaillensis TaxID=2592048 RepID=A0A553UIA7_9DEIO|nr:rhodanese-like domain-containing protein [Deinococcus detaillensis]TSA79933.1 sulfurtransferase [Deinococcus detaillensis]